MGADGREELVAQRAIGAAVAVTAGSVGVLGEMKDTLPTNVLTGRFPSTNLTTTSGATERALHNSGPPGAWHGNSA